MAQVTLTIYIIDNKDFVDMAATYVNAFNNGAVPDMADAWSTISKNSYNAAYEKSVAKYCELTAKFSEQFPISAEKLSKAHNDFVEVCVGILHQQGNGNDEFKNLYGEKLNVSLQKFFCRYEIKLGSFGTLSRIHSLWG